MKPVQAAGGGCPSFRGGSLSKHAQLGALLVHIVSAGCATPEVVERPNSHKDQMRPCFGLTEERLTARRAKPSSHPVSTIGGTEVVRSFSSDGEGRRTKARVHSSATCTKVLAVTAPAHPGHYGQFRTRPANRAAKASTRYRQGTGCSGDQPFSPVVTKLSFRSVLSAADD